VGKMKSFLVVILAALTKPVKNPL